MSRILVLAVVALVGCSRNEPPSVVVDPRAVQQFPEDAFARGVMYLLDHQSPDGAWRSDLYATFKDGTALTPLVLCALLDAADAGVRLTWSIEPRKKAAAWLAKFARPDGTIDPGPDGFDYPVYTAALSVKALLHPENAEHHQARDAWVKYLKERQLTEKLGWKPENKQYGGWGYCRVLPRKPEPNTIAPPLIESNLSATLFALDALNAAGARDEETARRAAVFVRCCQNDDGGFHFIYDDPVRNKAGMASSHPLTFHSYGSTTADGLRVLVLCGFPVDSERRAGARRWLEKNFRADTHPGVYVAAHEPNREAVYYYYASSASSALRELKMTQAGGVDWAAVLAAELAKRQRGDGSWANPVELVRENEPLVATSNAVMALARCR